MTAPIVAPRTKGKFTVVAATLSVLSAALVVAAVASSEWKTYSSSKASDTRWGLFSSCVGSTCTSFKDSTQATFSAPGFGATCVRQRNGLVDRMNAVAGLLIIAILLAFLAFVPQLLEVIGVTVISKRGHTIAAFALAAATLTSFIGVVLFGATHSSWIGCGRSVCDPFDKSTTFCGAGYAYVFAIVGALVFGLETVLIFVSRFRPAVVGLAGNATPVSAMLSTVGITLIAVAVGSDSWHIYIPNLVRSGLFKSCTTMSCKGYDYSASTFIPTGLAVNSGCSHTGRDLSGFNIAAAVLLIAAAVVLTVFAALFTRLSLSAKLAVPFSRGKKVAIMIALAGALVFQMVGFILQQNLYDNWYYCSRSFCSVFTGYCGFGMSYGFIISSMCLTFFLLGVFFFEFNDWCCFHERFATGRHAFTIKAALGLLSDRSSSKPPLGVHAPPLPPTAAVVEMELQAGTGTQQHLPVEPHIADSTIVLPPGTWEYDSVSGYYWCEQVYLFYDPETRQYYDPTTDQWLNTDTATNEPQGSSPSAAAPAQAVTA